MKPEEIRGIAKTFGIHTGKLSKTELIKAIQIGEGSGSIHSSLNDLRHE